MRIRSHYQPIVFQLTPEQDMNLFSIGLKMKKSKLPTEFISAAIRTALEYEGVADLVFLWNQEASSIERDEIIADIQELIDDCSKQEKEEYSNISFNDLDSIRNNIRAFKDALLLVVNEQGGISKLAKLTHIPQPSLSRFFNSNAMPHRCTLLKIAEALHLNDIKL